jgi:hypothetical protein
VADESIETFRPTNGRVVGVLGLGVALVLLVLAVVERAPAWTIGLLATIAMLTWAAVLRPRVRIVGDALELRNMFITQAVPLAAIEEVAVRRVLVVRARDRRFVSPAIGRSLRQTLRPKPPDQLGLATLQEGRDLVAKAADSYPDFVEERIRAAASDHRDRLGIQGRSDEQQALADDVRREVGWPELGAMAAAVVLLLVGIVLAL